MPGRVTRPAATEVVPCNLCGASDYQVVGRTDRDGLPLQSVLCRSCGLVWTNPRAPVAEIDRYYEDAYRADYTGSAAPGRRKLLRGLIGARERLDALRRFLPDGASVLDVGCGAGELVFLLRRRGFDAAGVEPGADYADFARRVLGVPVQTATVDTAVVEPASLDAVTLYHALEHVADPKAVLSRVRTWLKVNGALVVEVPNVDSTVQAPAHRYHFAHLYHFSGATLGAIGQAAGYGVVDTSYSADGGNVICVFRRVDGPVPPPARLTTAAIRTGEILRSHTVVRHYLSATPYRRAVNRLRRRLEEDRLLRRLPTVDAIVRWGEASAGPG